MIHKMPFQSLTLFLKESIKKKSVLCLQKSLTSNSFKHSSNLFFRTHKYHYSAVSIKDMKVTFDPTKKT